MSTVPTMDDPDTNIPPPRDEYHDTHPLVPSPAYDFEAAYPRWVAADKAKHAMIVIEKERKTLEKELKAAKEVLNGMKKKRCVLAELSNTIAQSLMDLSARNYFTRLMPSKTRSYLSHVH